MYRADKQCGVYMPYMSYNTCNKFCCAVVILSLYHDFLEIHVIVSFIFNRVALMALVAVKVY